MRGSFSPGDVLGLARVSADGTGYVVVVRLAEDRRGAVRVAEDVAVRFDEAELAKWIADSLNRLCSRWSWGVVAGRMYGIDGLLLEPDDAGQLARSG